MFGSIDVEDSPAVVADDEETVKKAERSSGYREEVHCGNYFPMVLQECEPVFGRVAPVGQPSQIARDSSFANIDSEF